MNLQLHSKAQRVTVIFERVPAARVLALVPRAAADKHVTLKRVI
jgi:hypothetical protein